jgi:cell division transport system ATP-binding protein
MGQQQRVAIARAMVRRPSLLICDEPTANLDPRTSQLVIKAIDSLNRQGTTVIIATGNNNIVDAMRKRVVELDYGHVVRDQRHGAFGISR